MNKITLLPEEVANKIAAGEVIERPASIVKELVENSIDSGAKKIKIEISNAGVDEIKITDDGCGIPVEDLPLSIVRHSTSKILDLSDLSNINSLGFRGEALSSIAAISELKIITRPTNQSLGFRLNAKGGSLISPVEQCASNVGSVFQVKNLFFNTPARKKFLKSKTIENKKIKLTFMRLALAHPNIDFQLINERKTIFNFKPIKTQEEALRFDYFCNANFSRDSLFFAGELSNIAIHGWLSRPSMNGASGDLQPKFVNRRFIKDRVIDKAVRLAYRDIMFGKRLPPFLLFIRINPKVIDVNVHPSKEEIKFASPQIISQLVGRAFQNTLRKDTFKSQINSAEFKISPTLQNANTSTQVTLDRVQYRNQFSSESDEKLRLAEVDFFRTETADLGTAIGQIHSTFILAQNSSGVVIIDMHAAHERINFEMLKEQWKKGQIQKQKALFPIEISVNEFEAEEIEQKKENLTLCGFEIERIGKTTITIKEYPFVFTKRSISEAAMLTISNILKFDLTDKIDPYASKLLADMACKASLRAYDRITIDEMNNIIKKIESTENSAYCSHGRPVWRYMSIKELDKLFLRGQ
ncbi:MAG: hypothetical protein CBC29_08790 [Methylococcaceae bacterium TMED69]|nr:MAG: hypothetical protein CBC29_08790 [Methylococcaceae bacterium TMED69]